MCDVGGGASVWSIPGRIPERGRKRLKEKTAPFNFVGIDLMVRL